MKLAIRFEKIPFLQYIMIYFILISTRGMIFAINREFVSYIMIAVCIFITLLIPRIQDGRLYVIFIFLFMSIYFSKLLNNGGFGMNYYLINVAAIWIAYVAYKLDANNFADRFVKTVVFFAGISLVMWGLCFVIPNVMKTILLGESNYFGGTKGMLLYTFRYSTWSRGDTRNSGIYTEPGVYQIVLNAALYYLLFFRDRLHLEKKQLYLYLTIIIATLISSQSTTGFLCFGVIIICYFIHREPFNSKNIQKHRQSAKLKKIILLTVLIGVFSLYLEYLISGEDSILQTVLFDKLFDESGAFNLEASTGFWRMNGLIAGWKIFLDYPFGAGDNYYILYAELMKGETASGAAFTQTLGKTGIITFLIYCYFHVYLPVSRIKRFIPALVCILLWVINSSANMEIVFASFIGMALVGLPSKKQTISLQSSNLNSKGIG